MRKSQKPPADIDVPKIQQLLTIEDVSRVLNCAVSTVYELIHEGLPVIRLKENGNIIRVDANSLLEWLKKREQTS